MNSSPETGSLVTITMSTSISAQGTLVNQKPDGTAEVNVEGKIVTGKLIERSTRNTA